MAAFFKYLGSGRILIPYTTYVRSPHNNYKSQLTKWLNYAII